MRGAFAVAVTKHAQASAPDTLVGHAHCTGLHVIRSTPAGCSSMQDRYSLEAACTGNYVRATTSLRAAVLTVATGRRTHLLLQLQRHDCDGAHVLQVGFIANLSGERNHKIVQQVRSFTVPCSQRRPLTRTAPLMCCNATCPLYNGPAASLDCPIQLNAPCHCLSACTPCSRKSFATPASQRCRRSRRWGAWNTEAHVQRTASPATAQASWLRSRGRSWSVTCPPPTARPAGAAHRVVVQHMQSLMNLLAGVALDRLQCTRRAAQKQRCTIAVIAARTGRKMENRHTLGRMPAAAPAYLAC